MADAAGSSDPAKDSTKPDRTLNSTKVGNSDSQTPDYLSLLGCEQAWTPNIYLKSFDMDSVQVGKAVFVKESYTTLGIEPRTYSYPGRLVTILVSVVLKNI